MVGKGVGGAMRGAAGRVGVGVLVVVRGGTGGGVGGGRGGEGGVEEIVWLFRRLVEGKERGRKGRKGREGREDVRRLVGGVGGRSAFLEVVS